MRLNDIKKAFLASAALLSAMSMSAAERFVSFQQGDLLINGNDKVEIYMDANDCRGVSYAANALVKDISKVSGSQATITSNRKANHPRGKPSDILLPSTSSSSRNASTEICSRASARNSSSPWWTTSSSSPEATAVEASTAFTNSPSRWAFRHGTTGQTFP